MSSVRNATQCGLVPQSRRTAGAANVTVVESWFSQGNSTSLAAWTGAAQADDLMLVFGTSVDSGRLPTAMSASGMTFTALAAGAGSYMKGYYAWIPDGTARTTSITWSSGGDGQAAIGVILRNVNRTTPFDITGAAGDNGGANPTVIPSVTTVTPSALSLVAWSTANNGGSTSAYTVPTGWTAQWNPYTRTSFTSSVGCYRIHSAAGATGTVSITQPSGAAGSYYHLGLRKV